ncbi:hypothetical protein [Streptomyces sp. NPDC058735]|uniref:hypothetical protein n=1 Tax=unclassified Streptomyces TaxID=2593676 RepID=UPI0036C98F19
MTGTPSRTFRHLGFDGPVARLFPARSTREAVRDLLAVVAAHRDARAVPAAADPDTFAHPLDVLRAFARDPLGPLLRDRLDALELRAVPDAPTAHNAVPRVRALHEAGRRGGRGLVRGGRPPLPRPLPSAPGRR